MTKRQYLESRINDINETLGMSTIKPKMRRNQERALRFYQLELERETSFNLRP